MVCSRVRSVGIMIVLVGLKWLAGYHGTKKGFGGYSASFLTCGMSPNQP